MHPSEPIAWDPHYPKRSPILQQFDLTVGVSADTWPTLQQLNQTLNPTMTNREGQAIEFIPQDQLTLNYEQQIYQRGQVATRAENWHDYFNAHVWLNYPKTKAAINALQYHSLVQRHYQGQRQPVENAMTLFDENGVVIFCSNPELLSLLQKHAWLELFLDNRSAVLEAMRVVVIGHSMHEKALQPYLGMTAHAIIFEHETPCALTLAQIDVLTADYLLNHELQLSPKSMQPLPILGYPGWFCGDQDYEFYTNRDYFRPKC